MLPTLDARLTAAAELVLPGKPVADIGCDHGKLTAVLAASGKYPRVIGADLRPGPLAKAEQTLEHAGCKDRVELRLGDGLSVLSAGEVGTIVLAGVSAQTTWEIIEQAPWVSQVGGPRLVMVPATRHSELRRWLWEHGFALAADRPVQAAGRWYAVMAAEYTGEVRTPTFTECLFGRTAEWPEGAGYAAWQKAKLPRFRLGVPDGTELLPELGHVLLDAAAVELDLGLTGALVRHRATGAALPAQVLAQTDEARKHVLQLRVVDLKLRFLRAGAVREDVEDQVRSVNDFDLQVMREVRKL